jgi:hypothetical protein
MHLSLLLHFTLMYQATGADLQMTSMETVMTKIPADYDPHLS